MDMSEQVIDDSDDFDRTPEGSKKPVAKFALSDHMETFPARVVELTVPRKAKDWKRKLARDWDELCSGFADKTPGTRKLYMSRFRKAAVDAVTDAEKDGGRAQTLSSEVRDVLKMDEAVLEAVAEEGRQRLREYTTSLARITDWEAILEEFQLLLHHPEPRFVAIGLMGVTGRRFAEILHSGDVCPVYQTLPAGGKVIRKFEVGFSGQLKTRGAPGTLHGQTYAIPVNADAKTVINALERLRSSDEGKAWAAMDSRSLNVSVNKILNRALQARYEITQHWPDEVPLSLKMLRPFYAEVAFHYHAPETMTKAAYFSQILGHSADDYHSALSYMRFVLGAKYEPEAVREIKRLQKLLEEQNSPGQTEKDEDQ